MKLDLSTSMAGKEALLPGRWLNKCYVALINPFRISHVDIVLMENE
jgi:hypothetical protein